MYRHSERERRTLILAPTGRDAQLLTDTLVPFQMSAFVCQTVDELLRELAAGAGAALIAEECLSSSRVGELASWLQGQEAWSDIPILVLTSGGRADLASVKKANLFRTLGNVTLIERPARPDTIQSAVSAALRARFRQYEMRRREETLTRVNMDLEQFAYSASHDLQEPLRNIATYSELLSRRYSASLDSDGRDLLGFVRSGAIRMQALVHDLLIYTQASGDAEEKPELVDSGESLQKVLATLSETIRQSEAQIRVEPLPLVRIRPIHLEQLFQNLVGNALKYRGEVAPAIQISSRRLGEQWLFAVKDNGIGISPEYKEKVFGIFKRLHSNEKYAGTGIGLAICQRIVERNRGRIWVESELGRGATFFFSLPA